MLRPYSRAAGCVVWRQLFPLPSLPQLAQSSTVGSGKVPCFQRHVGRAPWVTGERCPESWGCEWTWGLPQGRDGCVQSAGVGQMGPRRMWGMVLESRETHRLGWQRCRMGSLQITCYPRNHLGQSRQKSPGEKSVFRSLPPQHYCRADVDLPPYAAKSLRNVFSF